MRNGCLWLQRQYIGMEIDQFAGTRIFQTSGVQTAEGARAILQSVFNRLVGLFAVVFIRRRVHTVTKLVYKPMNIKKKFKEKIVNKNIKNTFNKILIFEKKNKTSKSWL